MNKHIMTGCFVVAIAARTFSAPITWSAANSITEDSDVVNSGATVFAYSGGDDLVTLNGVEFTSRLCVSLTNHCLRLTGFTDSNTSVFTSASNRYASLSSSYKNILDGALYNGGEPVTITLKNLTVDRAYTIQLWVSDPRGGASTNASAVVDSNGPELCYNDSQAEGGVGSYAVGNFIADASTRSFTLAGDLSTQLNAIQLRVARVPLRDDLYWDTDGAAPGFGTADGIWGSQPNWSTNALGTTIPDQPFSTTISNVLHLGAASAGVGAGTINLSGTQSFDTLSFGVASAAIMITNGALELATPASTVRLNSITNIIAAPLVPGNGLSVRSLRPLLCDGFPTTVESMIFANATLADYTGAEAKMGGKSIASGSTTPTPATVYHWVNDGTNASFQVQTFEGGHTKAVKIALRQSGADIAGRVVYAKYDPSDANILGNDFDFEGSDYGVANWFNGDGYGVTELKLLPYDDRFIEHRFREFLSTNAQTIATGVNLADFSTVECFMAGASIDDDLKPASICYFVNDGATATFQARCHDDVYIKCVKVELTQVGNDIQARVLYAKYVSGNNLGHNFDLSGSPGTISTGISAPGYGLRSIRLKSASSTLVLTEESEYDGPFSVSASTLELEGTQGSGDLRGDIVNNGAIVAKFPGFQALSGNISGKGSFTLNGQSGSRVFYNKLLTTTPVVVAENIALADIKSLGGFLGGASISGGVAEAAPFFFVNDGTTATVQLQVYNGGHTKVAKVEFKQVGADIQAKIIYTKHCSDPHGDNVGADYDYTGVSYNYDLIRLFLSSGSAVLLKGNNTYIGGTVVNSGALEIRNVRSLPSYGGIVVNGGNLIFNAPPDVDHFSAVGGMDNSITVFSGGTLTLIGDNNAGYRRPICLDGGILDSIAGTPETSGRNYINNLTLRNGAQTIGNPIQIGVVSSGALNVSGGAPSEIASGVCCVNSDDTLTLNVADVTGDNTPDLKISGIMRDRSEAHANMPIIKNGAGTVSFSHSGNTHTGEFIVNAGSIALEADNTMNQGNSFVLNGGTLEMGSVANTVGTLAVEASGGTLALGSGTLFFADSATTAWSGTLLLTNTLVERSARFGTDDTGLTADQLNLIYYSEGKTVRINKDGYLTTAPLGSILILR